MAGRAFAALAWFQTTYARGRTARAQAWSCRPGYLAGRAAARRNGKCVEAVGPPSRDVPAGASPRMQHGRDGTFVDAIALAEGRRRVRREDRTRTPVARSPSHNLSLCSILGGATAALRFSTAVLVGCSSPRTPYPNREWHKSGLATLRTSGSAAASAFLGPIGLAGPNNRPGPSIVGDLLLNSR